MNRHIVIALGTIGLAASAASAQSSGLQIGGRLGASISTFVGNDFENSDNRTGLLIGGVVVFHKKDAVFGFQSGLSYVAKGASTDDDGDHLAIKLGYVEVPALLRVALPLKNSKFLPVLSAGMTFGLKTGCKVSVESGSASLNVDCDDSAFGGVLDFKRLDVGASLGVDVDIDIGPRFVLSPSIGYNRSLLNVVDFADSDAKNRSITIGAGFKVRM